MIRRPSVLVMLFLAGLSTPVVPAGSLPVLGTRGMVVSTSAIASEVGASVLKEEGGSAVDAAVATAFALAVTHPMAGNIGGGGFLIYRGAAGEAVTYDFREIAPARASATMFLQDGVYDPVRHHRGHASVGVPGTVAGLYAAWQDHGKLPWSRLVEPAIRLARVGFPVSFGLAQSLRDVLAEMQPYPASMAQFSKDGAPYQAGDILRQPDLGWTLQRIADRGPAGFYEGETALLIEKDMQANGGLMTRDDLRQYQAKRRVPVRGTYRGYGIVSMPPASAGGTALVQMLNILEGYDLGAFGHGSAASIHVITEAMRRAFADRAAHLGDTDFVRAIPLERLTSKEYARDLRRTILPDRASVSSPTSFIWPATSNETTQVSVVDSQRNAVSLTYTLEDSYGSRIVVPGAGFLLNNEMGDFNAGPGLTTAEGLIGTEANLAQPGKRMLSSMTPTIVLKDGRLFMVTGSPGGRTIINTVLLTILNAVDFGMNAQETVDAGRYHHQWLPDRLTYERGAVSPDTAALLRARGHTLVEGTVQGVAEVIIYNAAEDLLEGGVDRRQPDGAVAIQ